MRRIILDTSVVIKWFLRDEDDVDVSDMLFEDFRNKKILVSEPYLIDYELSNVISLAVKRNRISLDDGAELIDKFHSLPIIKHTFTIENTIQVFHNSLNLNISSYDSYYVTLSEYFNAPFYTADISLVKKCFGVIKNIKELSSYKKDR